MSDFLLKNETRLDLRAKSFLNVLRRDIVNYGTLPDYTLRRIANISKNIDEVTNLMNTLGEKYLVKEIARNRAFEREIIIAVEEQISD